MHLRTAEWINLLVFSWLMALAWRRRSLNRVRRSKITGLGIAGVGITLFVSLLLPHLVAPLAARVSRDWISFPLLLLSYWQFGQFVTRADVKVEERLERLDLTLVAPLVQWCARNPVGVWILTYLELAYLSYYPSLPLALAALYLAGGAVQADRFWTVVLLASYGSCSTLPFIQTRPPRVLGEKWSAALPSGKVRAFNRWILAQGSIHANTCPSAHVANATACALVLLKFGPLWLGLLFLWIAISIALGAVSGRYHYAADAILGALVAIAAFLAGMALAPHRIAC